MVSPSGLFGGTAMVLRSLPSLLYPEKVARMPYRFARHLEPEEPTSGRRASWAARCSSSGSA